MSRLTNRLDGELEEFMNGLERAQVDANYADEEFIHILKQHYGSDIAEMYENWMEEGQG